MISVRIPVNSRLLIVKFLWSQKLYVDFWLCGAVGTTNTHGVQGSTAYLSIYINTHIHIYHMHIPYVLKQLYMYICTHVLCNICIYIKHIYVFYMYIKLLLERPNFGTWQR